MAKIYGDRWKVLKSLRPRGQAETFLVEDTQTPGSEPCVLKRLRNVERHERFRTEVQALRTINSPHVVKLVDVSLDNTPPFLVMEYCRGGSLEDQRESWTSDVVRKLTLFAQICDGVAAAHSAGVIHRDIKPANVLMRGPDGPAVVGDFGIAFVSEGERLTLTDEAVGARKSTSPELADGRAEEVSPMSDVYSLGKLLYWMLAGGRVFDREQHRDKSYDLARGQSGRPELEHVNRMLDRMITIDPSDRLRNAGEVANITRRTINLLAGGVRVLAADITELCAFCRVGHYLAVTMENPNDVRNFGITPVGTSQWKVLVCDHCANIQLFRPDLVTRRWWGPPGKVGP